MLFTVYLIVFESVIKRSVLQNAPFSLLLMLIHSKIWIGVHTVLMKIQTI